MPTILPCVTRFGRVVWLLVYVALSGRVSVCALLLGKSILVTGFVRGSDCYGFWLLVLSECLLLW